MYVVQPVTETKKVADKYRKKSGDKKANENKSYTDVYLLSFNPSKERR